MTGAAGRTGRPVADERQDVVDAVLPTEPRAPGPVTADPTRRAAATEVATGAGDRSAPVRTDDLSLSSAHESLAPS